MSCCGHKRHQWQQNNVQSQRVMEAPKPLMETPVNIIYIGKGTCLIKGEQTGHMYLFGEQERSLAVDSRDVQQLVKLEQKFKIA